MVGDIAPESEYPRRQSDGSEGSRCPSKPVDGRPADVELVDQFGCRKKRFHTWFLQTMLVVPAFNPCAGTACETEPRGPKTRTLYPM